LALLTKNPDPNYVDNLINGIENEQERIRAKIEWEYAIEILKNHNYVQQLAASLNMNSDELNDLFGYANTL
jgi:3'-phosphoadenosine 5'-phosphosulfate sulfotransferase